MSNPYQEPAPADPPPPKPSLMQRLRQVSWEKAFDEACSCVAHGGMVLVMLLALGIVIAFSPLLLPLGILGYFFKKLG